MHSSTSSSKQAVGRRYRRASAIVLTIAVAILLAVELITRMLLVDLSRIERRQMKEYAELFGPTEPRRSGRRVLVVGNSLLLANVDFAVLAAALEPDWKVQRFAIDDTSYFDWLYGLRRIFGEGARFDFVAVMLTPQNLAANRVRGSYFARRLMATSDVVSVARDLDLHPTEATDLLVSNLSEFWGMRTELRKVLLGRLMPSLPTLTSRFNVYPAWTFDPARLLQTATARLQRLQNLAASHGSRLLFITPPLTLASDGSAQVEQAGRDLGIDVLRPVPSGTLDISQYSDGYHLNQSGAKQFTPALILALSQALSNRGQDTIGAAAPGALPNSAAEGY